MDTEEKKTEKIYWEDFFITNPNTRELRLKEPSFAIFDKAFSDLSFTNPNSVKLYDDFVHLNGRIHSFSYYSGYLSLTYKQGINCDKLSKESFIQFFFKYPISLKLFFPSRFDF